MSIDDRDNTNVEFMDDYRPHVVVEGAERVHVIPLATIKDLISGDLLFADVEDQSMLRDIVASWLEVCVLDDLLPGEYDPDGPAA